MKRMLVALTASTLLLVPTNAVADQHTFVGDAQATALKLTVTPPGGEPQGLTIGASSALVQSGASQDCAGTACATGAAAVEPFGETASVVAKDKPASASVAALALPEELQVLEGTLGAANVTVKPAPGPVAGAGATAAELGVNVNSAIEPIKDQLDGAVDQIVDGLQPILDPLQEGDPTELTDQVETLIDELVATLATKPLVVVRAGASTAEATDSLKGKPGVTTATATANGAVIELAPVDAVAPRGLFRIEVGASSATVSTNQVKVTKSSKGSIVKLFVADLTTAAPNDYQELDVATDQPEQCVGQSPLLLCIIVGGTAETERDGGAAVAAAAVRIRAFADADDPAAGNPLPGLTLAVAEASAGVNAAAAQTDAEPTPATPEEDTPTLPSTGGGLGGLGLAVLGAGALALDAVRRR